MRDDFRVVDRYETAADQSGAAQHPEQRSHAYGKRHNEQTERQHRDKPRPHEALYCRGGLRSEVGLHLRLVNTFRGTKRRPFKVASSS